MKDWYPWTKELHFAPSEITSSFEPSTVHSNTLQQCLTCQVVEARHILVHPMMTEYYGKGFVIIQYKIEYAIKKYVCSCWKSSLYYVEGKWT